MGSGSVPCSPLGIQTAVSSLPSSALNLQDFYGHLQDRPYRRPSVNVKGFKSYKAYSLTDGLEIEIYSYPENLQIFGN